MSGVYKQARSSKWSIRFTDEHGRDVRKSAKTRDKGVAMMILADELRAVELRRAGINAPSTQASRTPIGILIEQHLQEKRRENTRESWIKHCRYRLDKVFRDLRIRTINEINEGVIKRYLEEDLAEYAHATKNQYMMALRKFCQWAMEQNPPMLSSNPIDNIMPKLTKRAANQMKFQHFRRPLWETEIPLLLKAEPQRTEQKTIWHRFRRPLYTVAIGTGLRRAQLELVKVSMIRLDTANPHIYLPAEITKSGRSLTMPLSDDAVIEQVETLVRYAYDRLPKHLKYTGQPFSPVPDVNSTFDRDLARAGIPKLDESGLRVDFHSLRQTFASRLIEAEVPIERVSQLMDHSNIETTRKIYVMIGKVTTRAMVDRVPSLRLTESGDPKSMPKSMPN